MLIIIASKSIHNFVSNLDHAYFTSQFFRVAEMAYFSHVTAMFVSRPFNKEKYSD